MAHWWLKLTFNVSLKNRGDVKDTEALMMWLHVFLKKLEYFQRNRIANESTQMIFISNSNGGRGRLFFICFHRTYEIHE